MEKTEIERALAVAGVSIKKSNQPAVLQMIGFLVNSGKTLEESLAVIKVGMSEAFDAEGIKALEVERLVKTANGKLTEAYRVEASGILGNLDLASENADELEADYKAAQSAFDETPNGKRVAALRQAALQAQIDCENAETEVKATGEYKDVADKLNTWHTAAKQYESESDNLAALVRRIAGEEVAPSLTLEETEDGKGITFAPSGRKRTRRTSGGTGQGKGQPLTVVVNGEDVVYSAAAQAKKALLPEYNHAEMSRDAITKALTRKGYTVK